MVDILLKIEIYIDLVIWEIKIRVMRFVNFLINKRILYRIVI
jgi:hypothetical protein